MGDERLESGYHPETPAGDNLLRGVLANLFGGMRHWTVSGGGVVEENPEVGLTDLGSPSMYFNAAVLRRPVVDPADRLLDDIQRFYGVNRETPATVWSAWPTPDLTDRGWTLLGHPPLMLLPSGRAAPPDPRDLRVEELQADGGGMAAFERILVEGFPLEELLPYRPGSLMDDRALGGGFRCWMGWCGDRPVSVAGAFCGAGLTGVEWVVTMPEFRGRGYGTCLTWRAATCDPEAHAFLHASDDGRSAYLKMGFLPLFRFTLWQL